VWFASSGAEDRPDTVVHDSGWLHPSTVHGWAKLILSSDGNWSYSGHIHEAGFVGNNVTFTMALDYRDLAGNVLVFAESDSLGSTANPFDSRDHDWQQFGNSPVLSQNWEAIKGRGWTAELHTSTDPWQVFAAVLVPFAGAAVFLMMRDPGWRCDSETDPDNNNSLILKNCRRTSP
jgi:hypothetical protein